ncbi:hypothetical protein C900_05002 [Fulvivirga imtechensis AK7]|uniref:N-acetyltransferase domain-containing protein n=2 Tax=Fulvivirga TaxID=396811 RepID=L8JKZ4_9BACT|nr:hypothetical protein C900_05002 [Fulvivirga imtechensis AK7]
MKTMRTVSDRVSKNIENLTSLWRVVGKRAQAHTREESFEFCAVDYSEWPNRLWFHHNADEKTAIAAKDRLLTTPFRLVVPYWDICQSQSYKWLEAHGFEKQFEQVGMSLQLGKRHDETGALTIKKVQTEEEAIQWEQLFLEAFGYTISHRLLLPAYESTDFYVAFYKSAAVGTVILHHMENVMGIHAMGVIPEMRRKGFAEQMMRRVLNLSIDSGFELATLQASNMGKDLYLKLGFEEQFMMKNYVLHAHR